MAWAALRPVAKACIGGYLIGLTISDRYFSFAPVHGGSMRPTFEGTTGNPPRPHTQDTAHHRTGLLADF
uniref:Uncharacterized protein n=1 Tax=Aegilops tauschii subsp. strangulata TaxID=200361 RepID=A0A453LXJ3_AEGTS